MPNEKSGPVAPSTARPVCTVTTSPAVNGCAGENVEPVPFEYAVQLPSWRPDREPVTVIEPMRAGATPRKLIVVCGFAKWLPGAGDTVTVGSVPAACAAGAVPATTRNDPMRAAG